MPLEATTTIVECSGVGAGGITRILTETVRHWPAGHRLELIAVPAGWEIPSGCVSDATVRSRQGGGRPRTILSAAQAMYRATGPTPSDRRPRRVLSLSPSLAIAGSRLPVTTVVHDLAFRLWPRSIPFSVKQYRRISYGAAIRRSAQLLCISARTQHDLSGLRRVPGIRTDVWHPGSDLGVAPGRLPAELARVREDGQRYLVVAGHAPHKGVELAIEAVAGDSRFVLAVLTGGRRVPRFEEVAAASSASGRIVFLDWLSDEDYVAVVAGAAAFLMPSHFEGYGLPAAEALRLGTPTVISPDPALVEATGGVAARMDGWTAAALVRALHCVEKPAYVDASRLRSWRDATDHLCALLYGAPDPVAVPVPASGRG